VDELTNQEREFLQDIVTWWLDGIDDATEDVITDDSIDDVDQFVHAVQGMKDQKAIALSIKGKLDLGGLEAA
jgi:hypothetical protein